MANAGILKAILNLDVAGFGKGMNRALKDVTRFQRSIGGITRALTFFGGAFGLAFTGTAMVRGLRRRLNSVDELAKKADETGVSFKSLGLDLDETAVRKMQEAEQAVERLGRAFDRLVNVSVAKVAPAVSTAMSIAAEAIEDVQNPEQANRRAAANLAQFHKDVAAEAASMRTPAQRAEIEGRQRVIDFVNNRNRGITINPAIAQRQQQIQSSIAARKAATKEQADLIRANVEWRNNMHRLLHGNLNVVPRASGPTSSRLRIEPNPLDFDVAPKGMEPRPEMPFFHPPSQRSTGNPLWNLVRPPSNMPQQGQQDVKKIEENTRKTTEGIKTLEETLMRDIEQRRLEKANGGVTIN